MDPHFAARLQYLPSQLGTFSINSLSHQCCVLILFLSLLHSNIYMTICLLPYSHLDVIHTLVLATCNDAVLICILFIRVLLYCAKLKGCLAGLGWLAECALFKTKLAQFQKFSNQIDRIKCASMNQFAKAAHKYTVYSTLCTQDALCVSI